MVSSNSSLPSRYSASSGFTLIELMVTIAVMAIIVSIAAPNVSSQLANQRVKSTTATLYTALREAKTESMIRRQELKLSYDGSSNPKIIKIENADKKVIASYSYNKKSTIASSSGDGSITFKPGSVNAGVTYTICDEDNSVTNSQITVSQRAMITTTTGGTC